MTLPLSPSPLTSGVDLQFLRSRAPELARDIVCELDSASALAASYGLTPVQWDALRRSPGFRQMVLDAKREIGGPQGAVERIRRKAQLMLDQGCLLDLGGIVSNPNAPASARVSAFSELREVAGITKDANRGLASGASAGPLIVINLPGAGQPLTVGGTVIENTP
jgi:hypothetical protein